MFVLGNPRESSVQAHLGDLSASCKYRMENPSQENKSQGVHLGREEAGASQVPLAVKKQPANTGDVRDVGQPLGRGDPLEEGMTTHSSILAWRIPGAEEPSGL